MLLCDRWTLLAKYNVSSCGPFVYKIRIGTLRFCLQIHLNFVNKANDCKLKYSNLCIK